MEKSEIEKEIISLINDIKNGRDVIPKLHLHDIRDLKSFKFKVIETIASIYDQIQSTTEKEWLEKKKSALNSLRVKIDEAIANKRGRKRKPKNRN